MKIKTSELTDAALDRAVAKCEGVPYTYQHIASGEYGRDSVTQRKRCYSTDWSWGGPIIEREQIRLSPPFVTVDGDAVPTWGAYIRTIAGQVGPTPLIAAMRCYVASKMGEEIDVPEELL